MRSKPTLRDVSAAAKVSIYTASRSLNGGGDIGAETRQRVIDAAAQLGYVPNQHARSLKSPRSTVVAVLTANIANQYYAVLVNGLEAVIEGHGLDCATMDAVLDGAHSQAREDRFVASIMSQRVAAVVVTYNLSERNMRALAEWDVPLIFVDCSVPEGYQQTYSSITTDSFQGSREMGLHLASHGYKRWAFVGHTETWSTRQPRQAGFEEATLASGCTVDVIEGRNSSATACEAVLAYLAGLPRSEWPDAFYASNTVLLHGIFKALRRMNLAIPDDVAVVAFDDFDWAEMVDPPVTVIDQDIGEIGRAAGARILQQIRDPGGKASGDLVLRPTLKVRHSCGCGRVAASTGS